jgi:hypothetical protein
MGLPMPNASASCYSVMPNERVLESSYREER